MYQLLACVDRGNKMKQSHWRNTHNIFTDYSESVICSLEAFVIVINTTKLQNTFEVL